MGVIGVPAERATVFSLDRYVDLRALVIREQVAEQFKRHQRSSIIELRGGAGWGKTSAALTYAASRHRSGAQVILVETDGNRRICPATDDGDVLFVVDDCTLTAEAADNLLLRVQDDPRVQLLICSRERHPLIDRAHSNGLLARRIDLTDFRLTAQDLLAIGRSRGLQLDVQRAEYVVTAAGGWPAVAAGFLDLFSDSARDSSLATIDQLVTRSFEAVLGDLLGAGAIQLLATATLSGDIRREVHEHSSEAGRLHRLVECVRRLGLGEWVTP